MPRNPPTGPAAPASPPRRLRQLPPPPFKVKSRFDIESLLAKSEPPPRRESPDPSAWPTAAIAASSPALRFGCLAGTLPFPALFLAAQQPFPAGQACRCAAPACKRPGLEFSCCAATSSLAPPFPWRPGGPCKMKRVRTVFTPEQLERLEEEFLKQQYMVGSERVELAATLQLSETQVKVWFQNRRIKWRKQSLEQKAAKLSSHFGMTQRGPPGLLDGQESDREEDVNVDF